MSMLPQDETMQWPRGTRVRTDSAYTRHMSASAALHQCGHFLRTFADMWDILPANSLKCLGLKMSARMSHTTAGKRTFCLQLGD
jgi:hypothetical protein